MNYDRDTLRDAVKLLLSPRWGKGRIEKLRKAIKRLPRAPRLYRDLEPLNEFIVIAKQSPLDALNLVDATERHLESILKEVERYGKNPNVPLEEQRKRHRAENTRKYNKRIREALKTEEIRRGRRMTKEEAKAFLDERKRLWAARLEQYKLENPALTPQEAAQEFVEQLNNEVTLRYERARVAGAVKRRTHG